MRGSSTARRMALSALAWGVCAAVMGVCASPVLAQPAPYLKDAKPWYDQTTGIDGYWNEQGILSSSKVPVRGRAATTIDGKAPPLLPGPAAVLEKRLSDAEHGHAFPNTASECLPQGVPYMLFGAVGGPLQIIEVPGEVIFISDAYNEMWFVYLGAKHPDKDDLEPTYHGDSIGHWEGDTLVIDTVGLTTKTTLDQVGTPHSEDLHIVTRLRRTDPNTLEFLLTIEDPKTFSAPWQRRVIYKRAAKDARISEFACENNRNGPDANGYQRTGFGPQ